MGMRLWLAAAAAALAAGGVTALPTPASAQLQSQCASLKLKAAGSYFDALAKCEAKAAGKGEAADPLCVAKALTKLPERFTKAQRKDDCNTFGDAGHAEDVLSDAASDLFELLEEPPEVCCATSSGVCAWTVDEDACTDLNGVAGAPGSVCDASGGCVAPPGTAGPCCEDVQVPFFLGLCLSGPVPQQVCDDAGGRYVLDAVCTEQQVCLPPGAEPASRCTSAKLKAAGRYLNAVVKCEAKAVAKGVLPDFVCVGKAQSKLAQAFAKADAKGDCLSPAAAPETRNDIDDALETLFLILEVPPNVCCANGAICTFAADAAACTALNGTAGAAGTVCGAAGACVPPPAGEAACCEDIQTGTFTGRCVVGDVEPGECSALGGSFVDDAACLPAQICID